MSSSRKFEYDYLILPDFLRFRDADLDTDSHEKVEYRVATARSQNTLLQKIIVLVCILKPVHCALVQSIPTDPDQSCIYKTPFNYIKSWTLILSFCY